jgi:hypothetical protein
MGPYSSRNVQNMGEPPNYSLSRRNSDMHARASLVMFCTRLGLCRDRWEYYKESDGSR